MGVFSEEENLWNGGQIESDFQAWEYFIVGSGLPGSRPKHPKVRQGIQKYTIIS